MKLTVRVPATVANLGPGFDCLALALELFNEVTADTDAEPAVVVEGEGAEELPTDSSNLIVRSMTEAAEKIGRPMPPLAIRSVNRIPLERGLGSSAAAAISGLVLAHEILSEPWAPEILLEPAVRLEGHADNVAAALWGGLTLAYRSPVGWRVVRLEPHAELRPVLYIPEVRTSTNDARRALPEQVLFEDAVFTAGRAALLVHALTLHPGHLLMDAMQDRLHQDVRLRFAPESRELLARLHDLGQPACVAGAGPSIITFEIGARHTIAELGGPGPGWRAVRVDWTAQGPDVRRS